MIIDCAHYRDGRRQQRGALPLEEAAAYCRQAGFVWLGMFEPGVGELAQVRDSFGLHELAVEDAQTFHLRPKVEQFDGDVRLVILRTARYDEDREEVDFGEISAFVGPSFVITVRQGVASELRGARERLEANIAVISMEQTKISVRQSATMEQLTILATVFLPLTFVTGFFGQNFDWLLTHIQGFAAFAIFGIGGLAVPCLLLYLWFRRTARP